MPRAFLSALARALGLLALATLACAPGMAAAQGQSAEVSIGVPKGKVKSVRLRHLPSGTSLTVAVAASGRLRIAVVSAREVEAKSARARPLFSGTLERRMSFKLVIPETSDYYLVLDNRQGSDDVNATAALRAVRAPANPPSPGAPKGKGGERAGVTRSPVT